MPKARSKTIVQRNYLLKKENPLSMISPEKFCKKWDTKLEPIVPYSIDTLQNTHLPTGTIQFRHQAGLPDEAPPFLNFKPQTNWGILDIR